MKKILTFFFTLFALLAGAQTVVITQTGTGSGIDTSYQIGDSIYIVAGGTDTIFTGVAVSGGGGGGSGTVTSVAATVPTGFSVTGSPITTSGTLAITNNLAAGVVKSSGVGLSFTSGLVDIITETTGTLTPARGGTGLTALGTANQLLRINSGGTALEYFTPTFPTGGGAAGQVTYWTGASTQAGSTEFTIPSTGKILVGDASGLTFDGSEVDRASFNTYSSGRDLQWLITGHAEIVASDNTAGLGFLFGRNDGGGGGYLSQFVLNDGATMSARWGISSAAKTTYRMNLTTVGLGLGANITPTEVLHVSGNILATGVAKLGDGTAGAPAYTFSADPNTGLFRPTTDVIGFSTNGAERARITVDGRLGIGTTSPTEALEVNGNAVVARIFSNDGTAGNPGQSFTNDPNTGVYRPTTDTWAVSTGGTERMRIGSTGNVGIGVASALGKLHITNVPASTYAIFATSDNAGRVMQLTTSDYTTYGGPGSVMVMEMGAGTGDTYSSLQAYTAGKTTYGVLSMNATGGNVAIGSTTAAEKLTVAGNIGISGVLKNSDGTAALPAYTWSADTNTGLFRPTTDVIGFSTGGAERARIDASGQLLIGTTTAVGNYHTIQTPASGGIEMHTAGTGGPFFIFNSTAATSTNRYNGFLHQLNGVSIAGWGLRRGVRGYKMINFMTTGSNMTFDSLGVGLGGTISEGLDWTSNYAIMIPNSTKFVGLGTSTPANKLDVEGSLAVGATYSGTTAAPTNGAIIEGNVGIGTNSPFAKLEVQDTGTSNLNIALFDRASSPSTGNYTQFGIGLSNVYTTGIRSWNEGGSNFSTSIHTLISGISNTVPAMYLTHQNKVGINQDTAVYFMDVKGSSNHIRALSTSTTAVISLDNSTTGTSGGDIIQSGNNMLFSAPGYIDFSSTASSTKGVTISEEGAFFLKSYTSGEATALTAANGQLIYVNTTGGVFTAVGFWGRENGTWIKL